MPYLVARFPSGRARHDSRTFFQHAVRFTFLSYFLSFPAYFCGGLLSQFPDFDLAGSRFTGYWRKKGFKRIAINTLSIKLSRRSKHFNLHVVFYVPLFNNSKVELDSFRFDRKPCLSGTHAGQDQLSKWETDFKKTPAAFFSRRQQYQIFSSRKVGIFMDFSSMHCWVVLVSL